MDTESKVGGEMIGVDFLPQQRLHPHVLCVRALPKASIAVAGSHGSGDEHSRSSETTPSAASHSTLAR